MSALDDYPRELSFGKRSGRWVLTIHGVDLYGEVVSSQRGVVEAIAEAIARMWADMGARDA